MLCSSAQTGRVPSPPPPVACAINPLRCASPDQCRKTCGLFGKSPLVLPKISLLSDVSRPLFLPFPPHATDSSAFPPSPARIRKQFPQFPCTLPRSAESNCQFVSRGPRVGTEFQRAFTPFLAMQRPKTTTSKHIRAKYIQHDTCFRAFLSLAHKKVVHLQWIVVQLWHALAVALYALATQQCHFAGGRRNGFSFSPPPPSGARPQPTQNMASRYK